MSRLFNLLSAHATLRRQLSFTFMAGVLCLAVISSLTTSYLASERLRENLLTDGAQMTENFAARTGNRLALLYGTPENATDEASTTVAFPDVMSVKLYTRDKVRLVSRAKENISEWEPDAAAQWPAAGAELQHETAQQLYFMAPVYTLPKDMPETPFAEMPKPELLGYAQVVIGKLRLSANQTNIFLDNISVSIGLAVILLLLLQHLITRVTTPLGELSKAMHQAGAGATGIRAQPAGPADIVNMALVFNQMMQALEERDLILRQKNTMLEREVAQREATQRELSASKERFELAVRGSSDGIWDWDIQTGKVYFSPHWKSQLGYEDDEIQNTFEEWKKRLHPEDRLRALDVLNKYLEGSSADYALEHRLRHKDGSYRWILSRALLLRDAAGKPARMAGSHTDVTTHIHMEEELRTARDAALEAVRLKAAFLANISHEIRTPLNGVLGMAEMLLLSGLSAEQREYAETVHSSGTALLSLINDILDFSKIEANKLRLEIIDFDPVSTIEGVVDLFAPRAFGKGIELVNAIAPEIPRSARGDPGRLRQVLSNLLGNAIKFTERGTVTVCARVIGSDGMRVRFEVRDSGIGITPEVCAKLFQPFVQADVSTARKHGGTGLGLAICKELVALMGGTIGIVSKPGTGSTFWFEVSLGLAQQAAPKLPDRAAEFAGSKALIVDHNDAVAGALQAWIVARGMRVEVCADSRNALEHLRAAARAADPYRIVLLDARSHSLEITTALQSDPALAAVRCILLVPYGLRGDAREIHPAGIAAYLNKPVKIASLDHCLATALSKERGDASRQEGDYPGLPESRTPLRAHILVVDDDVVNQRVAVGMLGKMGCRVEVAGNGQEALQAVRRATFDLVFMDCQMPEMDGFEATRQIRAQEACALGVETVSPRLPIVAMTANTLQQDREACFAAGMDDYLTKPTRFDALETVVRRWLLPKNASLDAEEGKALFGTNAEEVGRVGNEQLRLDPSLPELDALALDNLHALLGKEFPALVADFLREAAQRIAGLRGAAQREDLARVRQLAHTLKGSSGNMGAPRLSGHCAQLEVLAREGTVKNFDMHIESIEAEYLRIVPALQERATHSARVPVSLESNKT